MGYERKRGKLSQLNEYIRGADKNYFKNPVGDLASLKSVRYILTLDVDSTLPRETACTLIETMSHPMNHPRIDSQSGLVKTGYAILQPRVTIHLKDSKASHFSRIFSDGYGIDPYTKSVSDVYQDLFHEGSFIGKGIYDIDAFETAIKSRFPENRILSHDLIESSFARSGLVSDVQLVEEYPTTFSSDASRRHRWIRGDWQIASWMLPMIPDVHGVKGVNPLSHLARWKIFDNLRRSMTPIATFLLFLSVWSTGYELSVSMTLTLLGYLALPHILNALNIPAKFASNLAFRQILRDEVRLLGRAIVVALLNLVFLPYEAYLTMNATMKSVYRLLVSKRKLLEWRSSAEDVKTGIESFSSYSRLMWFAPFAAILGLGLAIVKMHFDSMVAFPIIGAWFFAPFIAWWISRPLQPKTVILTSIQKHFLRALSRKTWLFFETFVTAADNWLPPDNFQEFPAEVIAHRTSPTNIGLSLLSGLGAYDFGYISISSLINKIEQTFGSLDKLERYKGHFYNWYDTETLAALYPHYVSTVDSGNLQGALLVLRQGLIELAEGDLLSPRIVDGLEDGLLILEESLPNSQVLGDVLRKRLPEIKVILDRRRARGPNAKAEDLEFLQLVRYHLMQMGQEVGNATENECSAWIRYLVAQVDDHRDHLLSLSQGAGMGLRTRLIELSARASEMMKIDYSFLYNKSNKLLAIGYHVGDSRLDQSYYDLLASEARLASFLAIADGSLPQEHWFALGRQLTYSGDVSTLLSWSGSMFEYLMPLLIMPSYEGTLLDQACRQCIHNQIRYGRDRKVPWGISESAYNLTDSRYNYQYRAFGVPGLGFKRGLDHDLVIAPYATVMSLMLEPKAACINLQEMALSGLTGRYGFYEAIDYTPSRVPAGEDRALIRSFMIHHQGMSFLSLLHYLLNEPMQARMSNDPTFKATELLLHERVPKMTALFAEVNVAKDVVYTEPVFEESFRIVKNPSRYTPEVHLLGNESYHVVLTSAGSGYSSWKGLMLTRWREDRTRDAFGYYLYIQDQKTSETWSAGFQPSLKKGAHYEAIFSEGRAEIRRSENGLDTHLEIAVSPDDDAEMRRLTLFNHSDETKVLDITSYAEVVLAPIGADMAHPAFSNLFVESELIGKQKGILCRRRGRDPAEANPWLYHNMCVHGASSSDEGIETDRAKFTGRNRDLTHPLALDRALTNSVGAVLDPIISMRKRITLPPGETVVVDSILGIHMDRSAALAHMERFAEKPLADRILELAWTHGHVLLQQINCSAAEALLYGKLASSLIYGGSKLRTQVALIKANPRPLSAFWSYGISGDHPIVLLRLFSQYSLPILQQVVRGHDYWRRKGLTVDLIIWNEDRSGYRQDLNERILEVVSATGSSSLLDKHGGIFVRRPDQMPDEDRIVFQSAARVILSDQNGTLEEQINSPRPSVPVLPKNMPGHSLGRRLGLVSNASEPNVTNHEKLLFDNGIGGFRQDGKEYVMRLGANQRTPLPWVNVLANADFGSLVSEAGSSYTWSENAHEHRLTPWFNDPVSDPSGEALYIRDENSGDFWSATPSPCPGRGEYKVRHGFGYSSFSTESQGIDSVMTTFVAAKDPVKVIWIKLSNRSNRSRNLSLTAYFEIVLGEHRSKSSNQIVTEHDSTQGIAYARNIFAADFRDRIAFLSSSIPATSFTGDRTEFIGRNNSLSQPAAMDRVGLSGQVGALYDPCLAMQVACELAPGETKEIAFVFGAGRDLAHIRRLSRAFRSLPQIQVALDGVHQKWARLLGRITVETPDQSLNTLSNGWLLYQTISSRIWGRSGFYQSGGAYGFRDQLQDMMAVVYSAPEIVREHIIRSAGRQFYEGDVQHWWHPPQGRGVRTKISDDYLWLPFVTDHYIKVTGDRSILDETTHYLSAKTLEDGAESEYSLPLIAEERGNIYEHCVKALLYGMKYGSHGLPLMGSGDWNDGMNHVGIEGRGESVWLGFFLLDTLNKFSKIADLRNDLDFANVCWQNSSELKNQLEKNAWDGSWYLRAYCDDGSKLGSAQNQECRIDSLPQSWSVLSGGGTGNRAEQGMKAVYDQLVREDLGIIKLFDPPFDKQLPNPGYISGYLPGVRENGGQYTHAAIWVVMAAAQLGDVDRALAMLRLINPVLHADSAESAARYQIEPYVLAGDVYAADSHRGRGGWSWYTGSAAWFYRAVVENFVGFDLQGDKVRFTPKLPSSWPEIRFEFWFRETRYQVLIKRNESTLGSSIMFLDGVAMDGFIPLLNDQKEHIIDVSVAVVLKG